MKKRLVGYILILKLLCLTVYGQVEVDLIDWGHPVRSGGYHELLGSFADHYFVLYVGSPKIFSHSATLKILKYNSECALRREYEMKDIIGGGNNFIDAAISNKGVSLLIFNKEGSNHFVEQLILDPQNLGVVKKKRIKSFKSSSNYLSPYYNTGFGSKINISSQTTENDDYTVMYVSDKENDYVRTEVLVFDRNNQHELVNEFELDLAKERNHSERVESSFVEADGSLHLLLKSYGNANYDETKKGKPDYEMIWLKVPREGEVEEFSVSTDYRFLQYPKLLVDDQKNMYIGALYEYKHGKGASGVCLIRLKETGVVDYKKYSVSKGLKKNKDKLDEDFEITSFEFFGSGFVVAYHERESRTRRMYNDPYQNVRVNQFDWRDEFRYKSMIVDGFDVDGNYLWSNTLENQYEQDDANMYITNKLFSLSDKIFVFQNIHEDNYERLGKEKMKFKLSPSKKNIALKASINHEGVLAYSELTEIGRMNIFPDSIKLLDDEFVFTGWWYGSSDWYLGKLSMTEK